MNNFYEFDNIFLTRNNEPRSLRYVSFWSASKPKRTFVTRWGRKQGGLNAAFRGTPYRYAVATTKGELTRTVTKRGST